MRLQRGSAAVENLSHYILKQVLRSFTKACTNLRKHLCLNTARHVPLSLGVGP